MTGFDRRIRYSYVHRGCLILVNPRTQRQLQILLVE